MNTTTFSSPNFVFRGNSKSTGLNAEKRITELFSVRHLSVFFNYYFNVDTIINYSWATPRLQAISKSCPEHPEQLSASFYFLLFQHSCFIFSNVPFFNSERLLLP